MQAAGRRILWQSMLAAAGTVGLGGVSAQTISLPESPTAGFQMSVEPQAASRCLTTVPGAPVLPVYPIRARQRGTSATIKVSLHFAGPDRAAEMSVIDAPADAEDFVAALQAHARDLRVPCMTPGAPNVSLLVEFVFRPDDRPVTRGLPSDAEAAEWERLVACIVHARPGSTPRYPDSARRAGVQGRLLARLRFVSASAAPEVEVIHRLSTRLLRQSVASWAEDLRMPCHAGRDVDVTYTFEFSFEGEDAQGFRAFTFPALLGSARGIREQGLQLDTTTMGCPFEVQWQYRRPQMRNAVGVVGQASALHRPVLEWLETVHLDLPAPSLDAVWGDSIGFVVPCVQIDLKPG